MFSSNSEANASELLENIEIEIFPQYYMHSNVCNSSESSNTQ